MRKNSDLIFRLLKYIIIVLAISLFVVSGIKLYNYSRQLYENEMHTNILKETTVFKNEQEEMPVKVDFSELKKQSEDIIAWIYAEDTLLDNPIVQADDNEYYLRRLINGNYNIAGTLFADFRNLSDFSDFNTVIYGHNMNNGSMFGFILNYRKQEYYDNHKFAYLATPDRDFKIEFIAGMTVRADDEIYSVPMPDEKIEVIKERIKENSDFVSKREIKEGDKLVTLSTCSYSFKDARYVLIGVIEEI